MSILTHQWSSYAKVRARFSTIANPYRKAFGSSLPVGEQYWTMCGKLANNDGTENKLSEYNQMVRRGLITKDQFYGVEREEEIHLYNKTIHPDLNLYHADFYEQMVSAAAQNNFNPAIVNADLVHLPDRAAQYFCKILALLSSLPKNRILLVCNLILDNPRASKASRKGDTDRFLKNLNKEHRWNTHKHLWSVNTLCYNYDGNGKRSNSNMCTYLFFKK